MLKKTITYPDFNGVERKEDFYFNLSKAELTEMELSVDGGMANLLQKMVDSEDSRQMFGFFKQIILASVGIKSDDGKHFRKSDEIAQDFISSPAFDILFMSFATDANMAAEFVKGIIPPDLVGDFDLAVAKADPSSAASLTAVPAETSPVVQG